MNMKKRKPKRLFGWAWVDDLRRRPSQIVLQLRPPPNYARSGMRRVVLCLCLLLGPCNVLPTKLVARWTLDWEPAQTAESAIGLGAEG